MKVSRRSISFVLAAVLLLVLPRIVAQDKTAAPAVHESHAPAASASKAPPPKAEEFIKVDSASPKTVLLTLIAAYNDANYGMNFNGFAKGNARCVVPKDWTLKVTFRNQSPVPHSVIVVERPMVKRLQMGEPYFKGASTPDPVKGTTGAPVTFQFIASEAGDFALACGFPAHAANGHWIALEVSDSATTPSLQFGQAEPYVVK